MSCCSPPSLDADVVNVAAKANQAQAAAESETKPAVHNEVAVAASNGLDAGKTEVAVATTAVAEETEQVAETTESKTEEVCRC